MSDQRTFWKAQAKLLAIATLAGLANNWPWSFPRNDNVNTYGFFGVVLVILVGSVATITVVSGFDKPNKPGAAVKTPPFLGREQTEEWKGWMQILFIAYHYYRARFIYNEIRVFVSSYVWMTGFGNFLYFDRKKDFSLTRMVSMVIRINWFPVILGMTVLSIEMFGFGRTVESPGTKSNPVSDENMNTFAYLFKTTFELYYVVPLHTLGFFATWLCCWVACKAEVQCGLSYVKSRIFGMKVCLLLHVLFFETGMNDAVILHGMNSYEINFRFVCDKYSCWQGIVCGFLMEYCQSHLETETRDDLYRQFHSKAPLMAFGGISTMVAWYVNFGSEPKKKIYNATHVYLILLPIVGYLWLRNCTEFVRARYAKMLEFFGKITLETYVMQFHLFMCRDVQHILVLLPFSMIYLDKSLGQGEDQPAMAQIVQGLNMVTVGFIYVMVARMARDATVETQMSVTNIMSAYMNQASGASPVKVKPDNDGPVLPTTRVGAAPAE